MYTYDMYLKNDNVLELLDKESSGADNIEIMTGASTNNDGKAGFVPAPVSADKDKYLKGDGTWSDVNFAKKAEQDNNGNNISNTYAKRSLYGDTVVSVGRKSGTDIGKFSFAFGADVEASGVVSYAEGGYTIASSSHSHAEGGGSKANGTCSHAEGYWTEASGQNSHAEGYYTIANNTNSHACGRYNVEMISSQAVNSMDTTAFVVGNGDDDIRSNAFSIMFDGKVKAASTITAETTADYAEFFEWKDNNPNTEDRVGKFVTLHGDKISIAHSNKDYILGIVSGAPFVLGNGDCDVWNGTWMRDEFNRIIYEPAPKMEFDEETKSMKEVFDKDGNPVYEGKRRKLNPDYDPAQKYISRFDRAEWSPVGMLGVLSVIQDGTCEVNGYCCCNKDGIATACDRNTVGAYRVIKKISDTVVRVIFR